MISITGLIDYKFIADSSRGDMIVDQLETKNKYQVGLSSGNVGGKKIKFDVSTSVKIIYFYLLTFHIITIFRHCLSFLDNSYFFLFSSQKPHSSQRMFHYSNYMQQTLNLKYFIFKYIYLVCFIILDNVQSSTKQQYILQFNHQCSKWKYTRSVCYHSKKNYFKY